MRRFLNKFGRTADAPTLRKAAVQPLKVDRLHFVVGDVHGCAKLLDRCINKIREIYANKPEGTAARVVFVGDYIDRGDDSATVLRVLRELTSDGDTVCLMGNHEKMMLDFLGDPARKGRRWLRYGGLQTLASFGVRGVHERMEADELEDAARAFEDAAPDGLLDWMAKLPLVYQNGSLTCVHAAVDPDVSIEDQTKSALLWGHPEFQTKPHMSGQTIAFGHVIQDQAYCVDGYMALDTGAYATGRLSMAIIDGDELSFVVA